jgi:hypothetical protein
MKTAVEFMASELLYLDNEYDMKLINKNEYQAKRKEIIEQAKEMEKNDTDNKVIHFAEWLTKKHTATLITLYEHFEEQYYKETFKSE